MLLHSSLHIFFVRRRRHLLWPIHEYQVKVEHRVPQPESCRITANEIMYEVGYSDTKAFRTSIKKITGLSPVEYKNRYNKQAVAV